MYGREKKLSQPKTQKQFEESKINSIRNPLYWKIKKLDRIIKDRTIRDILILFKKREEKKERKKLEREKRN